MFGPLRAIAVGFALSLLVIATAQADNPPPVSGQMVKQTYTNAAGTRTYYLYVPTTGAAGRPLMVWLHGCGGPLTQKAGHALAAVAEQDGFSLIYPDQTTTANIADCWNWYLSQDNRRDQGEASIIAGITTSVRDQLGSDPSRVYLGGYSAGGAMTTVMGATYPDVYAAIAPSAGAPYDFGVNGTAAFHAMGPFARPVPAWLLQGLTDEISNYLVGRSNLLQWLNTDALAGGGSVSHAPSHTGVQVARTSFGPLPLVVEDYVDGGCELASFNTSPLEHLINGYLISTDAGLGLERMMMSFLLAHRLGHAGQGCG
jgi:poly(hydroxyalkanoate) depolymerase family esterase